MIVDLNLRGRTVLVVGGGREACKRIRALLREGCHIEVIGKSVMSEIAGMGKDGKIKVAVREVRGAKDLRGADPDMVVAATNNHSLNASVVDWAKQIGAIAYSSDDPARSDFANLAVIEYEGRIRVAVSTGGRSPAVAKGIAGRIRERLDGAITKEDSAQARVYGEVREALKAAIPASESRREAMHRVMEDENVRKMIRDGREGKAREAAERVARG